MSLIKCPHCGQTVLSVASTCPKCSERLTPDSRQVGGLNDLTECPGCNKLVDRRVVECPNCGYNLRRARWVWGAGAGGAVVVAVLLILVVARGAPETAEAPTPEPLAVDAPTEAIPIPAPPPVPVETTTTVTPRPVRTATAPLREDATPDQPPLLVRWTVNWVNIREGRGSDTPVARVLRPATQVAVATPQRGWWAVYIDGVLVGYVAADLLDTVPPPGLDSL